MQQLETSTKSISTNFTKLLMIKQNLSLMMVFTLLWPFYAVADFAAGLDAGRRGDYATAYKEYKLLAEQGEAAAQNNLAIMFEKGQGVQQNYKTAAKWYLKAAVQGQIQAQESIGVAFYFGEGVQQSYKTAEKWFRKAAVQGSALAQFNLATMFAKGQGVQQNYKTAAKWFRKAAVQGHIAAQSQLGQYYFYGQGVTHSYVQAHKWLSLAAASGDKDAQKTLKEIAEGKRPSGNNRDSSYTTVDPSLVRDIQSHLKALGYDPGPPDGVPGRRTVTAVKAFQREWDIQPDGVLSSTLLKVLKITFEANSKSNQPTNKESSFAGSGSGFTVGRDFAVTNHHVIDGCSKLVVYINGNPVAGSVVASSVADDLALIKLTEPTSDQARFRASGRARLGEDVWVVGYPLRTLLASGLNVVSGEISALSGLGNNAKVIQISAPVQLGNSGGPLLDNSGNVVGVVVSKLDAKKFADAIGDIPQNINFAIKGAVVRSFLDIHGIDYQTDSAEVGMHGEEIAAKARKFTVPVECYK